MEQEALVFCEEAIQANIPPEVLQDIGARHGVEISSKPGQFVIQPSSQAPGAHFQAKRELLDCMKYYRTAPAYQWCWQKDAATWMPYDEANNTAIEEAFNRRDAQVQIVVGSKTFVVDFIYQVQYPITNPQMTRMILRNPLPTLPNTCWQFFHDNRWKNFNRETSDIIERAVREGIKAISVPFGKMGGRNVIDFERKVMEDARGNFFNIQKISR